jgi:hypothetical protein
MPKKDWPSKVGCGSPWGSLKFEEKKDGGHEIGRHVEQRGRKGRKKKNIRSGWLQPVQEWRGKSLPLILAGARQWGLCKHLNPIRRKRSGVEGSEVGGMKCSKHASV